MARLIKMQTESVLHVTLQTIFEDDSVTERSIAIGDVVQNLRYVKDGELITVSGKVIGITYSLPSKITFNRNNPSNTFSADIILSSIKMDCSTEYESNVIEIPVKEIVEDEGVENVKRMKYFADLEYKISMYYSNRSNTTVSLKVGDRLDGVRIMTNTPGVDITGEFEVIAFAYVRNSSTAFTVNGIVIENEQYGTIIADLDKILALTELMTYETSSLEQVATAIADARDGETIKLSANIDASAQAITVNGKNINIDLAGNTITGGNGASNGILVTDGKLTISGGTVVSEEPYDSDTAASALISVKEGGELLVKDLNISAVMDNAVENGQFGIGVYNDGKATIDSGEFTTGWYCVCTEGATTTPNATIEINGGELTSTVDFAVYLAKGKLIINDGEITGGAGAVSSNGGEITINGGVLKSTNSGNTGSNAENSGTAGQSPAVINLNAEYEAVTCNIHGGKFIAQGNAPIIIAGDTHLVTVSIDGGKFNKVPDAEWIAEGYTVTETPDADGLYEVIPA